MNKHYRAILEVVRRGSMFTTSLSKAFPTSVPAILYTFQRSLPPLCCVRSSVSRSSELSCTTIISTNHFFLYQKRQKLPNNSYKNIARTCCVEEVLYGSEAKHMKITLLFFVVVFVPDYIKSTSVHASRIDVLPIFSPMSCLLNNCTKVSKAFDDLNYIISVY